MLAVLIFLLLFFGVPLVCMLAVRVARDAYGRWHAALRRLAAVLDGTLDGYRVTGIAAPERPWERDAAPS